MKFEPTKSIRIALMALTALLSAQSYATSYIGKVDWIEIWPSGNVAFKLVGVTAPCATQQFIINKSNEGAKNLYAFLLTAKATGSSVTVAQSVCGPADGYGASYAIVDYLYYY
jgi:hypothetical protein